MRLLDEIILRVIFRATDRGWPRTSQPGVILRGLELATSDAQRGVREYTSALASPRSSIRQGAQFTSKFTGASPSVATQDPCSSTALAQRQIRGCVSPCADDTPAALRAGLSQFYNGRRRHSSLGGVTPTSFPLECRSEAHGNLRWIVVCCNPTVQHVPVRLSSITPAPSSTYAPNGGMAFGSLNRDPL